MFLASRMLGFAALCLCTALPLAGSPLAGWSSLFIPGKVVPGDILKIRFSYRNLVRYRTEMKAGDTQKLNLESRI